MDYFPSYINIHFVNFVLFLYGNVSSDVCVGFVHFIPVPNPTLPVSIASERPYTMTLMPQRHQRLFFFLCWRELANFNLQCDHWKNHEKRDISDPGAGLVYRGKNYYGTCNVFLKSKVKSEAQVISTVNDIEFVWVPTAILLRKEMNLLIILGI